MTCRETRCYMQGGTTSKHNLPHSDVCCARSRYKIRDTGEQVNGVLLFFIPHRNVIHERCAFQSRQQLANESVEEFARKLQTLAVHCEYKEQTNAYEVEREGTKPYRGKAESDGRGPFVGDIESDRTKPQVETGQSTAFLSVVDCTEKKDAWFVTLKVKRMRLRFKIDTGADVTIITKKTWLAMKDVSLNSLPLPPSLRLPPSLPISLPPSLPISLPPSIVTLPPSLPFSLSPSLPLSISLPPSVILQKKFN